MQAVIKAVQGVVSHQRNMCDVKGYVTAIYDGAWWVACVTGTTPEMQEVTLSFLHPRGPSRSFLYPHKADILAVHISDILTLLSLQPTLDELTLLLTMKWTEQHKHFRIANSERVYIFTCVCMYGREGTGEKYLYCILCMPVFPSNPWLSGYDSCVKSQIAFQNVMWLGWRQAITAGISIFPCAAS